MIIETNLTSWNGFYKKVSDVCGTGCFGRNFLFRGQRDLNWELESSFDRSSVGSLVERENSFDLAVKNFADRMRYSGASVPEDDQLIGLAQHYGMPTRILDWSYSPYVAMFFACSGAFEANTRPALYILDVEGLKSQVSERSELSIVEYNPDLNERLRNQRGCFTRLRTDSSSLDEFFAAKKLASPIVTKVKIGKAVIRPALEQLFSMDITYERLFPGFEGSAKQSWLEHLMEQS